MKINIRGEKVKVTEAIEEFAKDKLGKLNRYFDEEEQVTATVLIKVRKDGHKVEVTIPYKKFIIRVEEKQEDIYAAIDVAMDKLERQIRKNKTKIEDQTKKGRQTKEQIIAYQSEEAETEEVKEENPIVKRKSIELKPMGEEEAALQMELLEHDFYIFKDGETMEVKVIYKRKEKGYGIIEIA